MTTYKQCDQLHVAPVLVDFIETEVLPDLPISADQFWQSLSSLVEELTPINKSLLQQRDDIQIQLDDWNANHVNNFSPQEYKSYLKEIGYLVEEGDDFRITTENVDIEITTQAGPQLVVPTSNARFALNATNARWGSLYDALYGTDAISSDNGAERSATYNPKRGDKVIEFGRDFLDANFPLVNASHKNIIAYRVADQGLQATNRDGTKTCLKEPELCIAYNGVAASPSSIVLKHNGLHVVIEIDPNSTIGKTDAANVKDITLEAALTTIQDFEDSVAAVDAEDKVVVYRNWLGLMKGTLQDSFEKNGQQMTRTLNPDRLYTAMDGSEIALHGRSLLFCRNVGHLMTNPAILDQNGEQIYEGIMDAMISTLAAMHDLKTNTALSNSRSGSIYIVKPKMHGPEEVAFANTLFNRVEDALGLARHTIKIGVMDEERRTTVNLKECIRQVQDRAVFINTGFLDRTGDEIHTSMLLGAMAPKAEIKVKPWILAYEDWNVDIGLECGFLGKAQIGKGMWAMPDEMAEMLETKIGHPESGANTAWVPSPIGAVLHATHYHQVNVFDLQQELTTRSRAALDDILSVPLCDEPEALTSQQIQNELDNNVQGILGYVVRWIDQGVGCSKVPDINDIGLMEDRATLRISSQHIANWLHHGVCDAEQVNATFQRMAEIVDKQNANDPLYTTMTGDFNSNLAYRAALDLVFKGKQQPNGYTEPLLHQYRLKHKAS